MADAAAMSPSSAITLRPATSVDRDAIDRLAALDSTLPPRGPVLVAEADGEVLAARSLQDGHAVADPFAPTAGLLALLERWAS